MAQAPDFATAPASQQLTNGARASLELELQDAKRDLRMLMAERGELFLRADVCFALASEPGQNRVYRNTEATDLRLKAFLLSGRIGELELKVKSIESRLKSPSVQAAPVVLTAEQCADMDDTHNFQAVAA